MAGAMARPMEGSMAAGGWGAAVLAMPMAARTAGVGRMPWACCLT